MSISGVGKTNLKVSVSQEIAKDLKLSAGETIEGRVIKLNGDKALVFLKGKAITADLNVNLAENQKFFVQVMGNHNGRIILQVVQPKMQGSIPAPEVEALKHFGFPLDDDYTEVAKILVDNNLPLNKRNIEWLYNNYMRFNREISASFLAYLLGREIPISEYIVSALTQLGNSRLPLHQLLARIRNRISEARKVFSEGKSREVISCLNELFILINDSLQENDLESADADELADSIKHSLQKMGYSYEYGIKDAIDSNTADLGDEKPFAVLKGKALGCLEQIDEELTKMSPHSKDNVTLLQYDLLSLVKLIDAQQILSVKHSSNIEKTDYYTFMLPLKFADVNGTLQVKILRDGIRKKDKIDPDNIRMILHLDTQNLGQINLDITIRQKRIFCRFGMAENVTEFFELHKKEFENIFANTICVFAGMQIMSSEQLAEKTRFAIPGIAELRQKQELDLKI